MDTTNFADGQPIPQRPPLDIVSHRATDLARCRHCASVLVVAHLRCDDGALLPVYRCPVCRHLATRAPSVGTKSND